MSLEKSAAVSTLNLARKGRHRATKRLSHEACRREVEAGAETGG